MKRKILTRIEITEESGMPEVQIQNYLQIGDKEKLKTSDILFIEEFCHRTGLDQFVEPKKAWRDVWKTQRALRDLEENKSKHVGVNNA